MADADDAYMAGWPVHLACFRHSRAGIHGGLTLGQAGKEATYGGGIKQGMAEVSRGGGIKQGMAEVSHGGGIKQGMAEVSHGGGIYPSPPLSLGPAGADR